MATGREFAMMAAAAAVVWFQQTVMMNNLAVALAVAAVVEAEDTESEISPPPAKRRKKTISKRKPKPSTSTRNPVETITLPPCDPDALRLISWNIDGIAPFLQKSITSYFHGPSSPTSSPNTSPPVSLRGCLHRHDWPAILFLQEVKIGANDTKTQNAVRAAVNDPLSSESSYFATKGPKYDVYFTLPTDKFNARGPRGSGRVYGVATIVRSDLASLFALQSVTSRTVDWDKEGRVNVLELTSSDFKLALFNIYAVNGTEIPYRDPKTGANVATRHDRKQRFHCLLRAECAQLERDGWRVVLAGDFNVAPDERDGYPKLRKWPPQHAINRQHFQEMFLQRDCQGGDEGGEKRTAAAEPHHDWSGMDVWRKQNKDWYGVDVWREKNGDRRGYTWYSRAGKWGSSCDRVDYVIAGKSTWEQGRIVDCGILESEGERGPSDHCPVWADIRMSSEELDMRKTNNKRLLRDSEPQSRKRRKRSTSATTQLR